MEKPYSSSSLNFDLSTLETPNVNYLVVLSILYRLPKVTVHHVMDHALKDSNRVIRPGNADKLLNRMVLEKFATREGQGKRDSPRFWSITDQGRDKFRSFLPNEEVRRNYVAACIGMDGQNLSSPSSVPANNSNADSTFKQSGSAKSNHNNKNSAQLIVCKKMAETN